MGALPCAAHLVCTPACQVAHWVCTQCGSPCPCLPACLHTVLHHAQPQEDSPLPPRRLPPAPCLPIASPPAWLMQRRPRLPWSSCVAQPTKLLTAPPPTMGHAKLSQSAGPASHSATLSLTAPPTHVLPLHAVAATRSDGTVEWVNSLGRCLEPGEGAGAQGARRPRALLSCRGTADKGPLCRVLHPARGTPAAHPPTPSSRLCALCAPPANNACACAHPPTPAPTRRPNNACRVPVWPHC